MILNNYGRLPLKGLWVHVILLSVFSLLMKKIFPSSIKMKHGKITAEYQPLKIDRYNYSQSFKNLSLKLI